MTLSNDRSPLFECEDDVGGEPQLDLQETSCVTHCLTGGARFSLTMAKAQSIELAIWLVVLTILKNMI